MFDNPMCVCCATREKEKFFVFYFDHRLLNDLSEYEDIHIIPWIVSKNFLENLSMR